MRQPLRRVPDVDISADTVRRSHETHERRRFNPSMSQVGESVLTRWFPPDLRGLTNFDSLERNRFVLDPTIVPVRVPLLDTQH